MNKNQPVNNDLNDILQNRQKKEKEKKKVLT